MSNPKHRTPLPDKEAEMRVVNAAITLGQEIEKHKQKEQSGMYTADPEWREARLNAEADITDNTITIRHAEFYKARSLPWYKKLLNKFRRNKNVR